jgi:hypothetical protein
MAAPEGNQFWKNRSEHGRKVIFADPDILLEEAYKYFDWVDTHPWYKNESIKSGDNAGTTFEVATQRPYTLSGLCVFLGVGQHYFEQFEGKRLKDFSGVLTHIRDIIRTQKFEGAAVGAFNPIIIARDLGLVDKKDHTTDGESLNTGYFGLLKSRKTVKKG